jgi:alpha-tubulin suppressor-like RCC1 family protein
VIAAIGLAAAACGGQVGSESGAGGVGTGGAFGTDGAPGTGGAGNTTTNDGGVAPVDVGAGASGADGDADASEQGTVVVPVIEATAIAASEGNSCVVLRSGKAACWGNNTYGQLGQGHTRNLGDAPGELAQLTPIEVDPADAMVAVALGSGSACGLTGRGAVYCWGRNEHGQLGRGDTEHVGDQPGEMQKLVAVPLGAAATALSLSPGTSCALLSGGAVKCWGDNGADNDLLGKGQTQPIGDDPGEVAALAPIDFGGAVATAISAGPSHACASLVDGQIACWGMIPRDFTSGWLAPLPVRIDPGAAAIGVAAGQYHTCVLLQGGQIKCWGGSTGVLASLGALAAHAPVDLGTDAVATAVEVGNGYSCALLTGGALECWGENGTGELGQGVSTPQLNDPSVLAPVNLGTGLAVLGFAVGTDHTCAIVDGGRVKCWGGNWAGALGLGDAVARGTSMAQMGDNLPFVTVGEGV